jgi:hypothetical protein
VACFKASAVACFKASAVACFNHVGRGVLQGAAENYIGAEPRVDCLRWVHRWRSVHSGGTVSG